MRLPQTVVTLLALAACGSVAAPAAEARAAEAPAAGELTFSQALAQMRARNETLQAADAQVREAQAERAAARGLYLPQIDAGARWTRIDAPIELDLAPIRDVILGLHPAVPASRVPAFVEEVQGQRFWKADVRATWPIFTGGRIRAANGAAEARLDASRAERRQTEEALVGELVRRYYGARLAGRAVVVRREVLTALDQHVYQARRLEEEGLLSKAERLHAEVAQAEAARQVRKAEHDLALATSALANTLAQDGEPPVAGSPLFVVRTLGGLEDFVGKARERNPALGRLAALERLARQGTRAERGSFLPEVYVFGLRELHEDDLTILEPTWAAGVGARLPLFTGGARLKRLVAARQREERVRSLARKAERDVATLVERSWRSATNALDQFDTLAASRELAHENVRVRTRAFEEGVGTSLEVVDAQLSLARVELERLAASYDFAVALADLLATSGEAGRFETLCAQAGGGVE